MALEWVEAGLMLSLHYLNFAYIDRVTIALK